MLVIIDNYDSFTYNLAQYFQILGVEVRVFRNDQLKVEEIQHFHPDYLVISPGNKTIFHNLPNPFEATRYHSLAVERESLPNCLEITAWSEDNEIMGIRHKEYIIEGVQFHPESILTKVGMSLLKNFLAQGKKR